MRIWHNHKSVFPIQMQAFRTHSFSFSEFCWNCGAELKSIPHNKILSSVNWQELTSENTLCWNFKTIYGG
jgi:hypothetical protein